MDYLIQPDAEASHAVLNAVAHLPTPSLSSVVHPEFQKRLSDRDMMRIAVLLAEKGRAEGGCPIGAVVRDDASGAIAGKGHNTLVQGNDPYNHGETSAMRDAGRVDFSRTTLYTTLSPCDICTALIRMRGFRRVFVGNSRSVQASADQNHAVLKAHGIYVEVLEDERGVTLYENFCKEHADLNLEDWKGLSGVHAASEAD